MKNEWFGVVYTNSTRCCLKRGFTEEEAEDLLHKVCVLLLSKSDLRKEGAISLLQKTVEFRSRPSRKNPDARWRRMSRSFDVVHADTPEHRAMVLEDFRTFSRMIEKNPSKDLILGKLDDTLPTFAGAKYGLNLLRKKSGKMNFSEPNPARAFEIVEEA